MNPTELSELQDLEQKANEAIARQQQLQLADLSMIPWTRTLQYARVYPVPEIRGMRHYGFT